MTGDELEVTIDGQPWHVTSEYAEYDAVHAVAGALLAGADSVEVERNPTQDDFLSPLVAINDTTVDWGTTTDGDTLNLAAETLDYTNHVRSIALSYLTDVSGVDHETAEALYDAGFKTRGQLRRASQADLQRVDGVPNVLAARIKADVGGIEGVDD